MGTRADPLAAQCDCDRGRPTATQVHALVQQEAAGRQTAHPHDRTTAIRDVDGMDTTLQRALPSRASMGWVSSPRGGMTSAVMVPGPSLERCLAAP